MKKGGNIVATKIYFFGFAIQNYLLGMIFQMCTAKSSKLKEKSKGKKERREN